MKTLYKARIQCRLLLPSTSKNIEMVLLMRVNRGRLARITKPSDSYTGQSVRIDRHLTFTPSCKSSVTSKDCFFVLIKYLTSFVKIPNGMNCYIANRCCKLHTSTIQAVS